MCCSTPCALRAACALDRPLIEQFTRESARGDPQALKELTARELDVLDPARGMSNAEIASDLLLGENTVEDTCCNGRGQEVTASKLALADNGIVFGGQLNQRQRFDRVKEIARPAAFAERARRLGSAGVLCAQQVATQVSVYRKRGQGLGSVLPLSSA